MKHVLFELEGCPFSALDNEEHIKFCLLHAAEASHSKVLKIETVKFEPQGVTGFALLADSHLSIHTWPEKGVALLQHNKVLPVFSSNTFSAAFIAV